MLYSRDSIFLVDVKSDLNSKELRTNLGVQGSNNHADGLFVKYSSDGGSRRRGSNQGGGDSNGNSRSKKKLVKCHYCHTFGHYKNECPRLNKEEANSLMLLVLLRILSTLMLP